MFFKVHILYIDEGAVFGLSQEQRDQQKQFILDVCVKYQFNLTVVPLEAVYGIELDTQNIPAEDLESDKYMKAGAKLT